MGGEVLETVVTLLGKSSLTESVVRFPWRVRYGRPARRTGLWVVLVGRLSLGVGHPLSGAPVVVRAFLHWSVGRLPAVDRACPYLLDLLLLSPISMARRRVRIPRLLPCFVHLT